LTLVQTKGADVVEVDVFWSYGLGATLAVASSRQLVERRREEAAGELEPGERRWSDPFLLKTLLFLSLIFVPSGAYLVWAFPSWETMHAGDRDMPAWLVAGFALTNVTQGLLAYLVCEWLIARGRTYLAWLQILVGYFGMFFILVHGWDGKGYERFFSPTHADFLAWDGDWTAWLTSDVALTLAVMGIVLVPVLMYLVSGWQTAGYRLDPPAHPPPGRAAIVVYSLATVFGAALGLAVAAHLAIAWLGAPLGIPVAIALVAIAVLPRGPVHALFRRTGLPAPAQPALGDAVRHARAPEGAMP
jgi:hypothetical protein